MLKVIAFLFVIFPHSTFATQPIKIEIGKSYEGYSNDELRKRVWQLEKAVAQLQDQVFQLAIKDNSQPTSEWTCQIQSFGKTHVASGKTESKARSMVVKKCSEASNAIHCDAKDAECGNE